MIERSGSWLCIGEVEKNNTCTYGQLPHHFVGTTPTFLALSGATQTGPNTFWTKAALQYARNSGNLAWLKSYMVRAALLVNWVRAELCLINLASCVANIFEWIISHGYVLCIAANATSILGILF